MLNKYLKGPRVEVLLKRLESYRPSILVIFIGGLLGYFAHLVAFLALGIFANGGVIEFKTILEGLRFLIESSDEILTQKYHFDSFTWLNLGAFITSWIHCIFSNQSVEVVVKKYRSSWILINTCFLAIILVIGAMVLLFCLIPDSCLMAMRMSSSVFSIYLLMIILSFYSDSLEITNDGKIKINTWFIFSKKIQIQDILEFDFKKNNSNSFNTLFIKYKDSKGTKVTSLKTELYYPTEVIHFILRVHKINPNIIYKHKILKFIVDKNDSSLILDKDMEKDWYS